VLVPYRTPFLLWRSGGERLFWIAASNRNTVVSTKSWIICFYNHTLKISGNNYADKST
jgi:hypothetical protein